MKKNSPQIVYDEEARVLSVKLRSEKSVDSDVYGNVVMDYNKKGEVVRMNIYNFCLDAHTKTTRSLKNFVASVGA